MRGCGRTGMSRRPCRRQTSGLRVRGDGRGVEGFGWGRGLGVGGRRGLGSGLLRRRGSVVRYVSFVLDDLNDRARWR